VILDRKYSQQETSLTQVNNTPPPFPKLIHNQPIKSTNGEFSFTKVTHDFERSIYSSVNSCGICNGKFKSTSKYIGLKCKNCHLNCHEQCMNESIYKECRTINNAQKNIWESLYPKSLSDSITDHQNESIQQNSCQDVLPAMSQLDTSIYSTHTSSCSTTPSSQYSHQQQNLNYNRNQIPFATNGRFDSDIGSVCGKKIDIAF